MLLLQEITEGEVQKNVDTLCGIFPEGIADKDFPADSSAPAAMFHAALRLCFHLR